MSTTPDRWFTPPTVARRLGIKAERVIGFIRSGELVAVNLASKGRTRPRYRIAPEDLQAFLLRRSVRPAPPTRRRQRYRADNVIEFY